MKTSCLRSTGRALIIVTCLTAAGCSGTGKKNSGQMIKIVDTGSYGYDVAFFSEKNIPAIELKDTASLAKVLILPGYQGRVMTSTAEGDEGKSFGWINYSFIESGVRSEQFNPIGGEERIWLGPEGGPFSVYFKPGDEQVFSNWVVPGELDTEPFEVVSQNESSVVFKKDFALANSSGTEMKIGIERTVSILSRNQAEDILDLDLGDELSFVAYQSENILQNRGQDEWNEQNGFLSIWLLAMFNPSEKGVVFIPFRTGDDKGKIVTDDYFGKVPPDRLLVKDGIIYFKTDGKYRSKIGISPERAIPMCGSYDPVNRVLTLLTFTIPEKPAKYVNSKWGEQDDPLSGDVVNSYNDGPVEDGSIMGPFYEIESSSPAALLAPGEKIVHIQRIFHITGKEDQLNDIMESLFGRTLTEVKDAFKAAVELKCSGAILSKY